MSSSSRFLSLPPSPLQPLDIGQHPGLSVWCKRDDRLHPLLSGNKWRKLKYPLQDALTQGAQRLLSFGGAYSNHLHALAAAGSLLPLHTIGVVRGETDDVTNPTLADLQAFGMEIHPLTRKQYQKRHNHTFQRQLADQYNADMVLPEGGASASALRGVAEIIEELPTTTTVIVTAVGSGTTLAGLLLAISDQQRIWAVQTHRDTSVIERIRHLLGSQQHKLAQVEWLTTGFDNRFGRCNAELVALMQRVWHEHRLPLEPVYTAKMYAAFEQALCQGKATAGEHIVLLHTGGLQGINGFIHRGLISAGTLPYWPATE